MPSNIDKELDEIVQQMLVDYTAWVNGEPMPWNIKKQEAKYKLKQLINSIVLEVIGEDLPIEADNLYRVCCNHMKQNQRQSLQKRLGQ